MGRIWRLKMHFYRIYLLDGPNFVRVESFRAEDDLQAYVKARQRTGKHQVELWCGERRLAKLVNGSSMGHAIH